MSQSVKAPFKFSQKPVRHWTGSASWPKQTRTVGWLCCRARWAIRCILLCLEKSLRSKYLVSFHFQIPQEFTVAEPANISGQRI